MDNMILLICSTCTCVSCIVFFVVRVNRNLANMSQRIGSMSPLVLTSGTMGNDGGLMELQRGTNTCSYPCSASTVIKTTPNKCSPNKATQP